MPKRKCIFNEKLQKMYPFLKKVKDDSHLSCLKCGGRFSMATRGRGDIIMHIQSKKHKRSVGEGLSSERVDCSFVASRRTKTIVEDIQMCRICRGSEILSSATNLFKGKHSLLAQIKNLTGCSLTDEIGLPKYICQPCEENLKKAHSFRQICLNSQLFFSSAKWREEKNKDQLVNKNCDTFNKESLVKPQEIEKVMVDIKIEAGPNHANETDVLEMSDECGRSEVDVDLFLKSELEEISDISRELLTAPEKPNKLINSNAEIENKSMPHASGLKEKVDLICDRCGNHFTSRQHFKTHLRRHTNNKPFKCEVCPKQCYTPTELKHHMRRHTGERPFACQYCQRRFTDYSTRVRHERTHTNERPYACTQCGKAFTRANLLRKHLLVHTGERPFKCFECNKSFQTRTSLTVHCRSIMHKQMVQKQINTKEVSTVEYIYNTETDK